MSMPQYSFVIPVYNEEETLEPLCQRIAALLDQLDAPAEVLLVDDGSHDASYRIMCDVHARDARFKVIGLSRNFGHQNAITAGMDLASGRAVVVMDADLQDPPEVVLEMIAKWKEGYHIVYACRSRRAGESWFKKSTAHLFYRLIGNLSTVPIPHDVGDFRLVDRAALRAFQSLRENNRYVRGMFSWLGFQQTAVYYERAERFAGETKYPLKKMLKFATDGIVSFSNVPLQLALNLGFLFSALSFLTGISAVALKWMGYTIPGWTSQVLILSFFFGVQLLVTGMMGEYVGRIYEEVKHRPLYIVREMHGLASDTRALRRAVLPADLDEWRRPPIGMRAPAGIDEIGSLV